MRNNCIYKNACGGNSCARCIGYQSISETKRRYKNAKTEKQRNMLKQMIDAYERRV